VSFKAQNVATNLSAIIFPEMISTLADFLSIGLLKFREESARREARTAKSYFNSIHG
jgi:hypothetical protein